MAAAESEEASWMDLNSKIEDAIENVASLVNDPSKQQEWTENLCLPSIFSDLSHILERAQPGDVPRAVAA